MVSTIEENIQIHKKSGFKRGDPSQRYRFRVWIDEKGNHYLIVNAGQKQVMVYKYDPNRRFLDYGAEKITTQAWTGTQSPREYHCDVEEQRVGR